MTTETRIDCPTSTVSGVKVEKVILFPLRPPEAPQAVGDVLGVQLTTLVSTSPIIPSL